MEIKMTLILVIPYLIAVFFVVKAIVHQQKTVKRKWAIGLLMVFVLYLPLGWDVILGRAYFYYLCSTQGEGGVHVYQTVELGSEYYDKDGRPKFVTWNDWFDSSVFNDRYKFKKKGERSFSPVLNIGKYTDIIVDKNDDHVLGDKISFIYFGGWFMKYTGFHVGGEGCQGYSRDVEGVFQKEFLNYIFIKK